jgi:hypothetical protein
MRTFITFLTLLIGLTPQAGASDLVATRTGQTLAVKALRTSDFDPAIAPEASLPVLALDVIVGETLTRHLVPGTEDANLEDNAVISYSDWAGTAILAWQSVDAAGGRCLRFASFTNGWSAVETLKLGGVPANLPAQIAISRQHDAFAVRVQTDRVVIANRTTFHIVWREGDAVRWVPLMFVEGQYIGAAEAFDLTAMARARRPEPTAPGGSLIDVAAADNLKSVSIAFMDGAGRLVELEGRLRPLRIEQIGPAARVGLFRSLMLYKPGDLQTLGEGVLDMLHFGADELGPLQLNAILEAFDEGILGANLAGDPCTDPQSGVVRVALVDLPSNLHVGVVGVGISALNALPEGIGATLIPVGRRSVSCPDLDHVSSGIGATLIPVGHRSIQSVIKFAGEPIATIFAGNNGAQTLLAETVRVLLNRDLPIPAWGAEPRLLRSTNTGRWSVAWVEENTLRFVEANATGWGAPGSILLHAELPLADALRALRERLE